METKKILFITGTRADFGKLKPLIREVENDPTFEPHIFATGMHMLKRYGLTVLEIGKEGFRNVYRYINQDAHYQRMDSALASTIQGLGDYIREFPPDMIVVHGDRVEALAGAVVGALNNILVAHVEGGELSGTVDELLRHSVTKLSHLHFVANEEARDRLRRMGERAESIFAIGSPDIDVMLSENLPDLDAVREKYEIPFADYGILLYHPVTTEAHRIQRHSEDLVAAVRDSGMNFVVIAPNNDFGSEIISNAYRTLEGDPRFRFLVSMRFEYFLSLLKHARIIVGNSSAGIREAPVYGTPSLNLGTRQHKRFLCDSIVNVPEKKEAMLGVLQNPPERSQPNYHFGRGDSARRFIQALREDSLWRTPIQKQFSEGG